MFTNGRLIATSKIKKSLVVLAFLLSAGLLGTACKTAESPSSTSGNVITSAKVNDLTVTLRGDAQHLKQGDQEVMLSFTDASGKPVEVVAVSLNFHMPSMGSMAAMNNAATFTSTSTPGVYRGKVNIPMSGEWQAQLAYEGPAGTGKTTFSVTAQ